MFVVTSVVCSTTLVDALFSASEPQESYATYGLFSENSTGTESSIVPNSTIDCTSLANRRKCKKAELCEWDTAAELCIETKLSCHSLGNKRKCRKTDHCEWDTAANACILRSETTSSTTSPTSTETNTLTNVCLTNPPDIYRTCFQRAVDPSNSLSEDAILRDKYNIGSTMYENGQDVSNPSSEYIAPYTAPYVSLEEELTNGTLYLAIVRKNYTDLTCDDQIQLESVTLKWLKVSQA